MKTVQIIYNRAAGSHSLERVELLRRGFEAEGAQVILCESGPGISLTIEEQASHVCAVGGDGTLRHVAMAVSRCGRPLPMSVYPGGTINLVHREIGSPLDPGLHAARLLGGEAHSGHYSVEINDTLFLACASVGPDSRAVAALSPALKRRIGKAAYAVALLGLAAKWRREPIRLAAAGRELVCEAFYVAKGRYFAGPWSFAPEAQLSSPLLHVVALRTARRRDFARVAFALFRGRPIERLPGVTAFTCTGLTAEAEAPLPVQADGDVVTTLPARIQLREDPILFC